MRNTVLALSFVALLSGCSTYHSANGGRAVADPSFCKGGRNGSAACAALVGAALIGVIAVAAH